jgi:hypothetical protein
MPKLSLESSRILPKRSHTCPICTTAISISDLPVHYAHERKQLTSTPSTTKRPAAVVALAKMTDRRRLAKRTETSSLLQRVRANRDARRRDCVPEGEGGGVEECPICGLRLAGVGVGVNEHVSSCLDRRVEEERTEEGDEWGVHEVHGRTRRQVRELLEERENAYADDGGMDVFVDVEGDVDAVYGRIQYTEVDLLNPDALSSKPSGSSIPEGN